MYMQDSLTVPAGGPYPPLDLCLEEFITWSVSFTPLNGMAITGHTSLLDAYASPHQTNPKLSKTGLSPLECTLAYFERNRRRASIAERLCARPRGSTKLEFSQIEGPESDSVETSQKGKHNPYLLQSLPHDARELHPKHLTR